MTVVIVVTVGTVATVATVATAVTLVTLVTVVPVGMANRLFTRLESLDSNKHLFVCVYLDDWIYCSDSSDTSYMCDISAGVLASQIPLIGQSTRD